MSWTNKILLNLEIWSLNLIYYIWIFIQNWFVFVHNKVGIATTIHTSLWTKTYLKKGLDANTTDCWFWRQISNGIQISFVLLVYQKVFPLSYFLMLALWDLFCVDLGVTTLLLPWGQTFTNTRAFLLPYVPLSQWAWPTSQWRAKTCSTSGEIFKSSDYDNRYADGGHSMTNRPSIP